MKLPESEIERFTSKQESRYMQTGVYFDAEKGNLVATNGHMLAVLPVKTEPGDASCLIPLRAFQIAREAVTKLGALTEVFIRTLKETVAVAVGQEITTLPTDQRQFPNYKPLLVRHYSSEPSLAVNVHYLRELYEGLKGDDRDDGIIYIWNDPKDVNKPALVATPYSRAVAMLMQCRPTRTAEDVYGDIVTASQPEAEKATA